MAYQGQIQYDPSRILASFVNPGEKAGDYFKSVAATAANERNAQFERQDKIAQRAIEKDRFDKQFALSKAAADMQAEKFGIDKATTQGNILASRDLQGATQGLVAPSQMDTINAKGEGSNKYADLYNMMLAKGAKQPAIDSALEAMQTKDVAAYNASPTLQRQYISGVNIDQGPQEVVVGMDVDGNPITKEVQGDVSVAQELKNKMLGGYDTRIAAAKLADENKRQFDLDYGLKKMTAEEARRHNKSIEAITAAEKAAKVEPITMSKMDAKGNIISMDVRTNAQLKQAEALGFKLGKTTLGHASTSKGGGASTAADNKMLRDAFGGSNIGGTSGNALVSLTDAFYSKHRNIPRTMIANKVAEIAGDNTFTDSVSEAQLAKAFKDYIK